jgi:glycosyltransferase involved in cell wall biosynthesis
MLDDLCFRAGCANLKAISSLRSDVQFAMKGRARIAYVVSRLQNSGGHLRLILDFIRSQPDKDHIIYATGVAGPSDERFLAETLGRCGNARFVAAPRGSFGVRLNWLQNALRACRPEHAYLFNHHQDSVAVAALVPGLGVPGSFCHHGDHHLCLGVHLEHLTHIDFHPMGYHYCRNELGIYNRYLPLTFEDQGEASVRATFGSGVSLTTATVARSNKVEIPYYVSYLELIPKVLKVTGGRHLHIGRLTPWAIRRMRSKMRELGISQDRLIYIEWTASVWKALQEHEVDVYIASFPYGAGLTLIEAMGAGIPVIMHQHIYSRVLSGLELAYPEAFHWADPNALLDHLGVLGCRELREEGLIARHWYETYHRPEVLRAYLRDPECSNFPVPPLATDFKPRLDEWAAWVESQLSFPRLAYRSVYRLGRRIRSWLS